MDDGKKQRETRVYRAITVRINADLSAEPPRWDIVTAKNISASGVLFNYNLFLEPGSRVGLRISLPPNRVFECEGAIVRNVSGEDPAFGTGASRVHAVAAIYSGLSAEEQEALRAFFAEHLIGNPEFLTDEPEEPVDDENYQERHKRIKRSFVVRMRRNDLEKWVLVSTQNVSASGLFFTHPIPFNIGEKVSLSIVLPFLDAPAICYGEVVRATDETAPGATVKQHGVAVRFESLDEEVRDGLLKYAERFGYA